MQLRPIPSVRIGQILQNMELKIEFMNWLLPAESWHEKLLMNSRRRVNQDGF